MSMKFQDPRGEYSRQCPYCLEYITVDHLNRIFCPVKNGIKDFCKNRFKRLKNNLMKNGIVLDKPESRPLKIAIPLEHYQGKKTIDESIHYSILNRNKKILESLLGFNETFEIGINDLKREGYEIDFFDESIDNPAKVPVHKVGRFAVVYLENNSVNITLFNTLSL